MESNVAVSDTRRRDTVKGDVGTDPVLALAGTHQLVTMSAAVASKPVTCYRDIKKWVKNHKKAIIMVSTAGVCTYYLVHRYYTALRIEREKYEAHMAEQRRIAEENAEAQLQDHFESIQRIADSTTLPSLLLHLKDSLKERVDLQSLTEKLMVGKVAPDALSSSDRKLIWEDIKILSFTRALCALYSLSLLGLFLRTQINILGRHVYFNTAGFSGHFQKGPFQPLSMSAQHRFIGFADFLSHRGLESLVSNVQAAVEEIVPNKNLKKPYTHQELRDLLMEIRRHFEESQEDWVQYLLPEDWRLPKDITLSPSSNGELTDDDLMLNQLLSETCMVLHSQEFRNVLQPVLDTLLEGMLEEMLDAFGDNQDVGVPLAKLLPPLAYTGMALLEHPEENVYVNMLGILQPVQAFCAMVYSSSAIS
ncbi:hypothetical protein CBR_g38112 [Chara braunii]|uniref:Peroxin-3 n=1 Tax=Chara braunii TaxID=69332 RepID=A0A388LP83_CHABU|nr:hypothetical protein CBR_g38112 [Chara braunii]|eukprot:GBG84138.1 hypothetical protein CBR_g38112 [Chara braunii]